MSKLYATLHTDEEIINSLTKNYPSDVITIKTRKDGGLSIEVKSKAYHKDRKDYTRIKTYLRKNGFSAEMGVHNRRKVSEPIRGENFKVQYFGIGLFYNPYYDLLG